VPESAQNPHVMRFGVFEIDLQAGELRKSGLKIKLQDQPFRILVLLLERRGQVLTREELRQKLWSADTFVEFDHSLSSAVKKLRQALGDDSDNPRFIETLPRRGYRLIVPVAESAPAPDQFVGQAPLAKPAADRIPFYYRLAILGGVTVLLAALVLWKTVFGTAGAPRVLRFTQLTNDGQVKSGSMATDGSRIYFNEQLPGPRNLIVQVAVDGGEVVPLSTPLKAPQFMDLSGDGTELLLGNNEQDVYSLWLQPVAGGSPRRVGTVLAVEARFGSDRTSIIYTINNQVYSVDRDGSSSKKLFTVDSFPYSFRFSPDAKVLRFSLENGENDSIAIMESAANGTNLHKLFTGCCGKWTADGRHFVFENRLNGRVDLWTTSNARRFFWPNRDEKPIQLTAGPLNFVVPVPSKDGKQLFAIGQSPRAEVVRYDSHSRQFVPYLSGISAEGLAFSRDGQWVAYASYPDGTLWRSKMDGSERLQLTFPPWRVLLPRWSPDGKQIAFNATRPDLPWNIYVIPSAGGAPERLLPSEQAQVDASWSPDGNSIAFGSLFAPNTPIYTLDVRTKGVTSLPGSVGLFSPRWSPDGKYIAAITADSAFKLMIFDFVTQKWTEAFGSGTGYPSWSNDGKYIYFESLVSSPPPGHESILRLRLSDRKVETVVDLKNVGRMTIGTFTDWFGLTPDESPLFARDISSTELYALDVQWP
jgi:Tol biopolymer transport system component/DNA-binding winged helix-turn-helix (wHTH) protein